MNNIQVIKQIDETDCLPTCALMILKTIDSNITVEKIKQDIKFRSNGRIPSVALATYLKSYGLDTKIPTYNMYYFNPEVDVGLKSEQLIMNIKSRTNQKYFTEGKDKDYHQFYINQLINALDSGVVLQILRPTIQNYDKELDEERVIISDVNAALWYGYSHEPIETHAVLITDKSEEEYQVHDPGRG